MKEGRKTEFRQLKGNVAWRYKTPTPVWLYARNLAHKLDGTMAILEESWIEPLMAISPESLEREGFATMDDFKRYWCLRMLAGKRPARFPALKPARVYRIGPWDADRAGQLVLHNLFGRFLS